MLLSILFIPFIAAIILLFIKDDKRANATAIGFSAIILGVALYIVFTKTATFDIAWLPQLNSRFLLQADGLAKILILTVLSSLI